MSIDFTGYYKSLTDERGRLVRRVARLEKRNAELQELLGDMWDRWDGEDTEDAPALALDLAIATGDKTEAQYIAQDYGDQIVADNPDYARKVARLLKPAKERK